MYVQFVNMYVASLWCRWKGWTSDSMHNPYKFNNCVRDSSVNLLIRSYWDIPSKHIVVVISYPQSTTLS